MTATNPPPPTAHTGTGQPPEPVYGHLSGLQAPSDGTPPTTDAADNLALFVGDRLPTDSTHWPTVDNTLTALLAGATVRAEWGCQHVWTTGQREPQDRWGFRDRADAESFVDAQVDAASVAARDGREWVITARLIRRFVVVTAAEVTP